MQPNGYARPCALSAKMRSPSLRVNHRQATMLDDLGQYPAKNWQISRLRGCLLHHQLSFGLEIMEPELRH